MCLRGQYVVAGGGQRLFRYADFVTYLGGSEYELGWIVGVGMLGSIAMRIFQGAGIDRYGARRIWLGSLVLVLVSLLSHLLIRDVHSVWIYLARILYNISLAGALAPRSRSSPCAPRHRTAEVIGALGSSGFIGMALGPAVADWLFALPGAQRHAGRPHVSGGQRDDRAGAGADVDSSPRPRGGSGLVALCVVPCRSGGWCGADHPGSVLLVAVALGMGTGIPFYFLRPFAAELKIEGIRNFFLVYSATAFAVRIACRQLSDRWGVKRTVLLGLYSLVVSMLAFLFVQGPMMLMLPAVLGGVGHAIMFPAAMAGGSLAFPDRYRGLATTLMLTMFDLGMLIGQPLVGTSAHLARRAGWPAYPTMFLTMTVLLSLADSSMPGKWPRRRIGKKPARRPSLEGGPTSRSDGRPTIVARRGGSGWHAAAVGGLCPPYE